MWHKADERAAQSSDRSSCRKRDYELPIDAAPSCQGGDWQDGLAEDREEMIGTVSRIIGKTDQKRDAVFWLIGVVFRLLFGPARVYFLANPLPLY
jgi:hypothetical protein